MKLCSTTTQIMLWNCQLSQSGMDKTITISTSFQANKILQLTYVCRWWCGLTLCMHALLINKEKLETNALLYGPNKLVQWSFYLHCGSFSTLRMKTSIMLTYDFIQSFTCTLYWKAHFENMHHYSAIYSYLLSITGPLFIFGKCMWQSFSSTYRRLTKVVG